MIDLNYKYYVYIACGLEGEVLYVGQGKGSRWQHCVSGASSNADINRYYFQNGEGDCIKVKIPARFKSKQRAIKREEQLIEKHLPLCNKLGVTTVKTDNMTELSQFYNSLKIKFDELDKSSGRTRLFKWVDKTRDFVKAIGYTRLSKGAILSPHNVRMYSDNNKAVSQYYRGVMSRKTAPKEVTDLFEIEMLERGEYKVRLVLNKESLC